ncbi:MAG: trypsin-like peptidase domain-containing protein [Candidatus Omnitrophica bacterium]|nr:trypsin-like peptidase domain-containing protein [Candidatus Omnitrophota bacterium]
MMLNRIIFTAAVIVLFAALQVSAEDARRTPVVKVVEQNSNAVVNISTERVVLLGQQPAWGSYGSEFDRVFQQFSNNLAQSQTIKQKGVGSGVILDKAGIIVTNAHVVNMASNIIVVLNDGVSIEGKVAYVSPSDDLAIIKIEPDRDLPEVKLAASGDIMVGETVVAIGNPMGLENSVNMGIVSGKNRNIANTNGEILFAGLIQTDAPINPGSSGGALFNLDGELMGINLAVIQNSQSIGFAIPSEKIRKILDDYKSDLVSASEQNKKDAQANNIAAPDKRSIPQLLRMRGQTYGQEPDISDKGDSYEIKMNIEGLDKSKIRQRLNHLFLKTLILKVYHLVIHFASALFEASSILSNL